MMFVFPVLIGVLLYFMYRSINDRNLNTDKSAEEILKERFVNGEIDEATYTHMKETLKK